LDSAAEIWLQKSYERTECIEWAHLFGADEAWKGNEILLRQGQRLMPVVLQQHLFFIKSAIYRADARCVIAAMSQ